MDNRYSALYQEISLRNEVLYLHGLYYQAPPPSSTSNQNPNPRPNVYLRHRAPFNLKRTKCRRLGRKKIVSGKEWPCDPIPDPETADAVTGWPDPPPKPVPPPLSAADLAKAAAASAQKNALVACKSFFSKKELDRDTVEGEESVESSSEEEDEEDEEEEEGGFKFFLEIITKDPVLRRFYDENKEKGEFLCLVCEGCGAKKGRKYGDLGALVQHCHGVVKLGRKGAHRGLAKAICKVAGWKFDRLPTLILDF